MERPTIAIITDDAMSATALTRRWLTEDEMPAFVLLQGHSDLRNQLGFDLAVLAGIRPEQLDSVVTALDRTGKPAILVSSAKNLPRARHVTVVPEVLEWPEFVVVLTHQILQKEQAQKELARTLEANLELEREASLGRYMLEVRHNVNNALTSVLGNSDLILLDAEQLPASLRSQVETIRNMAMRMNEILHRFTSLQKEMQLVEQQNSRKASGASAGA